MNWLIHNWFPKGNRGIDAAPEGGCKTIMGLWWAVCIAAGHPIFGCDVEAGAALIIDEETPPAIIEDLLNRFAQSLGHASYTELPITLLSQQGFRFGRKTTLPLFMDMVKAVQPVFIRFDSYLAMLPGGRQGLSENNSEAGIAARDRLNEMIALSPRCNTLLAAHSGAPVVNWSLDEVSKHEMNDLVRGHKSLIGEACDTGFFLKKLSQHPEPLRFAIRTMARRGAVPMTAETVFVEMQEKAYGQGEAKLVSIPPVPIPPSKLAKEYFRFFLDKLPHTWQEIAKVSALHTKKQNQQALDELLEHHVVLNHAKPFTYMLNLQYKKDCESEYLRKLA